MTSPTKQIQQALSSSSSSSSTPEKIDQLAKIRNWHRPKDPSEFYPHIQAFLSSDDEGSDPSSTVRQITAAIDAKNDADDEASWWDLWFSILHASRRISYATSPAQTDQLVALVAGLKEHRRDRDSNPDSESSSALPWLGPAVREAYNDAPVDDYDDDADTDDATIDNIIALDASAWANFNYFLARLSAAGIRDFAVYYALWAMRAALETDHTSSSSSSGARKFNAHVPAAAAWVHGMGRALLDKEIDLTPENPRQGNPAKGGPLWDGVAGFARQRWAFWKERFGVVARLEGVSEQTRKGAREAVERMESVEKEVEES